MSREIKFRAWDGKLMHTVSELHFCMGPKLDGKGLKFYGPGVGSGWIDGENVVLMQYTGLKDKNGKEIYEGDILVVDEGRITGLVKFNEQDLSYVIENRNGGYGFVNGQIFDERPEYCTYEVIGNCFEHPHLLEWEQA